MSWVQLLLLILGLLRDLKRASSAEEFGASVSAAGPLVAGNGRLIEWLWANREEIIELIFELIERFGGGGGQVGTLSDPDDLLDCVRKLISD